MIHIASWGIGLVLMMLVLKLLKVKGNVNGAASLIFLTLVPWSIGYGVFLLCGVVK